MAEHVVVDTSYVLEYILPTAAETQRRAEKLLQGMSTGQYVAVIPWLFNVEIAAVCAKRVRSKRLAPDMAQMLFETLALCRTEFELDLQAPGVQFEESMKYGCQVADNIFLTLAERRMLPIATVDHGMLQSAKQRGIPVWDHLKYPS